MVHSLPTSASSVGWGGGWRSPQEAKLAREKKSNEVK